MRVQVVLKDHGRGGCIELLFSHAPIPLAKRKTTLRFDTREPLILQRDRQGGPRFEAARKLFDARSHLVRRAIEVPRQADDNGCHAILLARETRDLGRRHLDRIALESFRRQHTQRSRQRTRGIAHRDADATVTDIKPDDPHRVTLY